MLLDESAELIMMKLRVQVTAVLNNYDSNDNYKTLKTVQWILSTHLNTCREKMASSSLIIHNSVPKT